MRRWCCALLVSLVALLGAPPAPAEAGYSPPVDEPVVDRFRPPATPYGPGNRGIDYATEPGEQVRAAADGEVVFAGQVGGSRHVVVLHPDGLRTSYSFLADVAVRRGDHVARGDVVGRAGAELHFGVRAGDDRYLDPEALLAGQPPEVHLVAIRGSVDDERRGLLRSLVHASAAGVAWARDGAGATWDTARARFVSVALLVELVSHYSASPARMLELGRRAELLRAGQAGCTPASVVPRRRSSRRIAVLVGGLGSSSGHAAVLEVDTRALGYADGDVAQFSYRGGQAPGERHLEGVTTTTYEPDDSTGDIRAAGDRLAALLQEIQARNPGVPVDLIAHSQGGIVARLALEGGPGPVEHVVTLGSPHHGADLATAGVALGEGVVGDLTRAAVAAVGGGAVDPSSVAATQLAETSDLIGALPDVPPGVRFTSIAARGDLVVPALQSALSGATNVVVPVEGLHAHDALPGSPEAARELALALADRGPTCRSLAADLLVAAGISLVGDRFGANLLVAGHSVPGPEVPVGPPPR